LHATSNPKLVLIRYPSTLDRVFLTRILVEIRAREVARMIRWERQEDGNWLGLSGELAVASVTRAESAERLKGWRKGAGHRTSWIEARRAAEEYSQRWLEEAALRPDLMRLAARSVQMKGRSRKKVAS
jgi:hypothetical protein